MSNKPFEFRPSGLIEFDQVEPEPVATPVHVPVDDALDTDPLSINFERRKDCKPTAAERMLAGTTIDWLVAFPVESRPKALCDRFPHVANRLATDWSHAARSAQSLQVLAGDARWGAAGFPAQVQGELQRLLKQLTGVQHPG
ncbi:hypothetical protein [Piscinibacter sp.]|jgi:hypothetical protein|uniref:hypothetical protein n=1 Tax=Piscinibacter sp. TaxID=1903157 RepID=UPI0035594672